MTEYPVAAETRIDGSDWREASSTRAVMFALEMARTGASRFVGGCVRNTIMGRPVDDIDIATQLEPEAVIAALEAAGIRALPTGIEHGTITAISEHRPYEITTLRRDVETDGRRAVVAFSQDWAEDAARRDFRLNALYAKADGTLHDPTGGGVADALAGRVIFIGDADQRLREDYLRILRFFRFNAWYGAGIDADGLAACARQKAGLKQIAAERIWKELEKLLRAPAPGPSRVVSAMHEAGILAEILPIAFVPQRLAMVERRTGEALPRLMALLPRQTGMDLEVSEALRLSNAEKARLGDWVNSPFQPVEAGPRETRAAAYRLGKTAVLDRLVLAETVSDARLSEARAQLEQWVMPDCPVRGQDLKDIGLSGPDIGEALRALEDWWVEQDFEPGREALLERLNSLRR